MNVVDSSGWLEFFSGGPNAAFFAPAIRNRRSLVVPTISILEVFKRMHSWHGEDRALEAAAHMQEGLVVPLGATLAMEAARISLESKIPMADSVILATARAYHAVVWTQDADFKGLEDVKYVEVPRR